MGTHPFHTFGETVLKNGRRGFTLVEMLVTIGIIGIIAALAIPAIGNINSTAGIATAQDNAQNITSVFSAGISAGAPNFVSCTSVREAQDAVGAGDYGVGTMSSTLFQLAGITQHTDDSKPVDQRSGYYLTWQNGVLVYDKSGGHFN